MKVRTTLRFSDEYRRALRHRNGKSGLATRAECLLHVINCLDADEQDLVDEMHRQEEDEKES